MNDIPLTAEQQRFAAENHGLVYSFLRSRQLDEEEFYDIVIFGFLRAVKNYFNIPRLKSYKFSTIAYNAMNSDLAVHFGKQNSQKRKAYTVSFEATIYGDGEMLTLQEVLPSQNSLMDDFETELLMLELASRISKREMDVIRMKAGGYGLGEIAKSQHMQMKGVKEMLAGLRDVVYAVCCG